MYKKCKRFVCYIDNSDIMVIFYFHTGDASKKQKGVRKQRRPADVKNELSLFILRN